MGYKLCLNDSQVFLIDNPVEQTTVKWQGTDTNAIKFVLSDTGLTPAQIKTAFQDTTATAQITIKFENDDLASSYSNYSVLASITQNMDDGKYVVTMAETSDLPALISALQTAVNSLNSTVTKNKSSVDTEILGLKTSIGTTNDTITENKESADTKFQNINEALDRVNSYLPDETPIEDMELADAKATQIAECKMDLEEFLEEHPITSSVHGNTPKQYAITSEKQAYLAQMISMATIAQTMSLSFTPSWNASGEGCTYDWTLQELTQLAFEIEARVRPLVSYQQGVESQINACESSAAVAAVVWDYNTVEASTAVVVPDVPPVTTTEPEKPEDESEPEVSGTDESSPTA